MFYHLHGSRSQTLIAQRLERIAQAVPLTDETALLDTFALRVQLVCRQLQLVTRAVAQYDAQIADLFPRHPDHGIFASLPGAGPVLGPRLLAALGSQRERYATAAALQCFTGIAPVTKQSGGKRVRSPALSLSLFHRQSFHEYAKESVLWCRWAAAYYLQQRDQGSSAPHRGAGAGVQMAAHHLALLAESHGLSGGNLRSGLAQTRQPTRGPL